MMKNLFHQENVITEMKKETKINDEWEWYAFTRVRQTQNIC